MDTPNFLDMETKVRDGAFSQYDMECLYPELVKLKPNEIYLEIGVDKGRSLSFARMVTNPEVVVCGCDIRPNPEVEGTRFYHKPSNEIAKLWNTYLGMWKISVLFIDGDHSYQGCKTDIDSWYPHMKEHGVMFFHDHDESSPGVLQAAAEFVNNHKVEKYMIFKKTDKNTSVAGIWL